MKLLMTGPALQDSRKCSSFKVQSGYSMAAGAVGRAALVQPVDPVRTGYRKHRSGSGHDVCETGMS